MLPERRRKRHIRFPVGAPAVVEPAASENPVATGEAQDLSQGGALLRLQGAVASGTAVRVTLRLHRQTPLALTGTVAWARPHPELPGWAIGIRFDAELSGEMVIDIADAEFPPWGRASVPERGYP